MKSLPVYAVSSGGVISVLAGTGGLAALELAGLREFSLLFGISGGAIVTALAAMKVSAQNLIRLNLDSDFGEEVLLKDGIFGALFGRRGNLPTGLFGSRALGEFIQKQADESGLGHDWPENYATMATLFNGMKVYFNKDGIFLITLDDRKLQLADKPPPLPLAVRASSAIPLLLTAIPQLGRLCFDGAYSREGLCPVGVTVRHFAVNARDIIACRVSEDDPNVISGFLRRGFRRLWLGHRDCNWGDETIGACEFRQPIAHLHALKFKISRDEKWLAILLSFESCLRALALRGDLSAAKLKEAQEILAALGNWKHQPPAASGKPQQLSALAESIFAEHGLY